MRSRSAVWGLFLLMSACSGAVTAPNVSVGPSLWTTNGAGVAVVTVMPRAPGEGTAVRELSSVTPMTNGGVTTSESGTNTAISVVLGSQPTANVIVTPSSSDTTAATVSGALTFTSGNWSTPQLITITGVDNSVADGSHAYVISVTTTSSDPNFNGINAALVNGTNLDNDVAIVDVITGGLTTAKDGTEAAFEIALTSQPLATVVVAVSSTDTTLGTLNTSALTFTTANWATPQTITVTGQANLLSDPSNYGASYFVQVGPSTTSDATYAAMPVQLLLVTNRDTQHNLDHLVLLAGGQGGPGNIDGTGNAARLAGPVAVTIDATGNIFFTDANNNLIRKLTPAGAVTTLAGSGAAGTADGAPDVAQFNVPDGICADTAGNLYVADVDNASIRKVTSTGVVSTFAGLSGSPGYVDAIGTAARFSVPYATACDATGNVYVADANGRIRLITPAGSVSTIAGNGSGVESDGVGTAAGFNHPTGIAVDAAGNAYTADLVGNSIRKITAAGVVTTLASMSQPGALGLDAAGNVYVGDYADQTLRKITPGGVVSIVAGQSGVSGTTDGAGGAAQFRNPWGVAADASGNVYVADSANNTVRKVTSAGVVSTFAGAPLQTGANNGTTSLARFNGANGLAVDGSGNVYVADDGNHLVRAVTPSGSVTTLAGSGTSGTADGVGTAAQFRGGTGVAVDTTGNVYVADQSANTIRKITAGGIVTTLAGTAGTTGTTDGVGTNALFNLPYDVAVDSAGNVYVSDFFNCTIRQITPAGVVSTYAGRAGTPGSTNATGNAARFHNPFGLAVDTTGDVYVADNASSTVRKIAPGAVVTTIAGQVGVYGYLDGNGTAAIFNEPEDVAIGDNGDVFVADTGNNVVRKIAASGAVTTVVGTFGKSGVSVGATLTSADLNGPTGIAYYKGVVIVSTFEDSVVLAAKTGGW